MKIRFSNSGPNGGTRDYDRGIILPLKPTENTKAIHNLKSLVLPLLKNLLDDTSPVKNLYKSEDIKEVDEFFSNLEEKNFLKLFLPDRCQILTAEPNSTLQLSSIKVIEKAIDQPDLTVPFSIIRSKSDNKVYLVHETKANNHIVTTCDERYIAGLKKHTDKREPSAEFLQGATAYRAQKFEVLACGDITLDSDGKIFKITNQAGAYIDAQLDKGLGDGAGQSNTFKALTIFGLTDKFAAFKPEPQINDENLDPLPPRRPRYK